MAIPYDGLCFCHDISWTSPYLLSIFIFLISLCAYPKIVDMDNQTKPLAYTSNCFSLLSTDVLLFFRLSITWPLTAGLLSIILPVSPAPSGKLDELALTWENFKASLVHVILCVGQLVFLFSLACCLLMGVPAALVLAYVVGFVLFNMYFCQWFLDGSPTQKFFAGREFAKSPDAVSGEDWVSSDPAHAGEKWVFINGVAVG
jgi:hypothetical protein